MANNTKVNNVVTGLQQTAQRKFVVNRTATKFMRPKVLRTPGREHITRKNTKAVLPEATKITSTLIRPIPSEAQSKANANQEILYYVSLKANKITIKAAFENRFNCKVSRVNTTITARGMKKAYIKLADDSIDASEILSSMTV